MCQVAKATIVSLASLWIKAEDMYLQPSQSVNPTGVQSMRSRSFLSRELGDVCEEVRRRWARLWTMNGDFPLLTIPWW